MFGFLVPGGQTFFVIFENSTVFEDVMVEKPNKHSLLSSQPKIIL